MDDPQHGPTSRHATTLLAWQAACSARHGSVERAMGYNAALLVVALDDALQTGGETPDLARAGRAWGAGFAAPVDALATLQCLGDVLVEQHAATTSADGDPGDPAAYRAVAGRVHRVLDQVMLDVVAGASGALAAAATTDPLTGCANRRALEEDLLEAITGARRVGLDLAVVMIDLDGLKALNDTDGHHAGDAALLGLVAALRGTLRDTDSLYRVGGDEFVVMARYTAAVGASGLMLRATSAGGPSFSWGVASLGNLDSGDADGDVTDPGVLLAAADMDLYRRRRDARRAGAVVARRRKRKAAAGVTASMLAAASVAVALGTPLLEQAALSPHRGVTTTVGSASGRGARRLPQLPVKAGAANVPAPAPHPTQGPLLSTGAEDATPAWTPDASTPRPFSTGAGVDVLASSVSAPPGSVAAPSPASLISSPVPSTTTPAPLTTTPTPMPNPTPTPIPTPEPWPGHHHHHDGSTGSRRGGPDPGRGGHGAGHGKSPAGSPVGIRTGGPGEGPSPDWTPIPTLTPAQASAPASASASAARLWSPTPAPSDPRLDTDSGPVGHPGDGGPPPWPQQTEMGPPHPAGEGGRIP